jgi:enamine deaminase RidA (YjgF/YER057c/UK114 family)
MEQQMEQTYRNTTTLLKKFGASLADVVEEVLYVLDIDAAFAVAGKVRKKHYGTEKPLCASNLIGVSRLALPQQIVEISFTAVLNRDR